MTGAPVIVGVDEAGRGPLAGPVVAGAVHLPREPKKTRRGGWEIDGVRLFDSKQLTDAERDESYAWITANCPWGVALSTALDIDEKGIMASNESAMQRAVAMLAETVKPTYLLVDGRDKYWFDYVHSSLIEGDAKEACIAAASIVAKVTRDRMMLAYAKEFPLYGFESHKGYAAPLHIDALKTHGPCAIHRRSFLTAILSIDALSGTTWPLQQRTPESSASAPR
jgi:ribonuclease HII